MDDLDVSFENGMGKEEIGQIKHPDTSLKVRQLGQAKVVGRLVAFLLLGKVLAKLSDQPAQKKGLGWTR